MSLQRSKRRAQPKKRRASKRELRSAAFAELLWPTPRVLAWIVFRESVCVEEDWQAALQNPAQPGWPLRDTDPKDTLLRALQGGRLRAFNDGKEQPPEVWVDATDYTWPNDVRFRRADVLALWPVHRERLLALARNSSEFEPVEQRTIVTAVIRESLWARTCTLSEILQTAYGDAEGSRYWELWLFEPLSVYQFADLLAVHRGAIEGAPRLLILPGMSMPVLDSYQQQIIDRLRAAAGANEPWFIGDTSSLATWTWFELRSSALAVRPREAVAWLLRNPNARHLVPTTLAEMLEQPLWFAPSHHLLLPRPITRLPQPIHRRSRLLFGDLEGLSAVP
jgi:hypothetical protein